MEVFLLGVSRTQFQGNSGFVDIKKASYLDTVDGETGIYNDEQRGFLPLTCPASDEVFMSFEVPGFYECVFVQRPDGRGRPVLNMASAKFLRGASCLKKENAK
jgi:hypothetical protein